MPLQYGPGDIFPDAVLADDTGSEISIAGIAGNSPLLLAFYRGPW